MKIAIFDEYRGPPPTQAAGGVVLQGRAHDLAQQAMRETVSGLRWALAALDARAAFQGSDQLVELAHHAKTLSDLEAREPGVLDGHESTETWEADGLAVAQALNALAKGLGDTTTAALAERVADKAWAPYYTYTRGPRARAPRWLPWGLIGAGLLVILSRRSGR